MIEFAEALQTMKTRGLSINEKEFFCALMVTLKESPQSAYSLVYEPDEYIKSIGGEHEEAYLASKEQKAAELMQKQNVSQLKELLDESFLEHVQTNALALKDVRFTGKEAVQILSNLLKTRTDDLESSSVKDVVSLLKALSDQGALDTGDGGFSRHFIQINPPFVALCTNCNKEFDAYRGVGAVCPHCHQQYRWSVEENRFYPEICKL